MESSTTSPVFPEFNEGPCVQVPRIKANDRGWTRAGKPNDYNMSFATVLIRHECTTTVVKSKQGE